MPLDPENYADGPTEYSWGPGLFPPGIADNEGQKRSQDDFGANLIPYTEDVGDIHDNYARAVADRRTDTTDPDSHRDFDALGNTDRYGANPALVQSPPQPNKAPKRPEFTPKLIRKA